MDKHYNPSAVENSWYEHWMNKGYFKSTPDDREPYTIVIPPPNVTGILHMGHILNNTIQDVLIRKARLEGYNVCWVPGTDHASIATEAKVVKKMREEGLTKSDVGRDGFMEHAWEWKKKYGGIILDQLKRLGASCDWDRTAFTMDPKMSDAVVDVFVELYEKGLIYKGKRMVNWDPVAKTALSDEEVIHVEGNASLYYVTYDIVGEDEKITIATTRPETILGDSAICVHPEDERFQNLIGKKAIVPLVNREIPIIADDYVDPEFGTGALKITPAHDTNDFELGKKHNLEVIDILDETGKLNENAQFFIGEDRFQARKSVVKELKNISKLIKTENIQNKIGHSERTNAVIEPRLSFQWFLSMKDLAKPALDNVMNDTVQFFPSKFKGVYSHWMENIKDWCVSRQLWWGQRIPAYYLPNGEVVVAKNEAEALMKAREIEGFSSITLAELKQDEDVVDTWFSSWLWPISLFDGFENPENEEFKYYYPTTVLVTGWDIIFFWVARMIIAGYEFKDQLPFKHVYFTGMVRDEKGRKMSKSLGNSPDALGLIDEYGADGVRFGMLLAAPAGNDLLFDKKLCEQGRNFTNKLWNALRLVNSWEIDANHSDVNQAPVQWLKGKFNDVLKSVEESYNRYAISEALKTLYSFTWGDYCSWYLEMIKPAKGEKISKPLYDETIEIFEALLKLWHPIMPFVTEELWHQIEKRDADLIVAEWPKPFDLSAQLLNAGELTKEVISNLRDFRNKQNLSPKAPVNLKLPKESESELQSFKDIIIRLGSLETFEFTSDKPENAAKFIVGTLEFSITAMDGAIDLEAEKERIIKELAYTKGFINSVAKKLENKNFVDNAPSQVIENEKKKLEDGEKRLKTLEASLEAL